MPEPRIEDNQVNRVAVPASPILDGPVTTMQHVVDWGTSSDLDDITSRRAWALAPLIAIGCWFLNPRFSVWSQSPTAAFFAEVRKVQASWLNSTWRVIKKKGQRTEARQTEQKGRRAAFLGLTPAPSEGHRPQAPSKAIPLGRLSSDQRKGVIEGGKLAKQLAFGGVLFINGELKDPPTWNRLADELLNPDPTRVTVIRRKVDLSALGGAGKTDALEELSRSAIRDHFENAPAHVAYITPLKTISAPIPSGSFLDKAARHRKEWIRMLSRAMGSSNHRRARLSSNIKALTVVYDGTLVHDGQLYRPDFDRDPGQSPDSGYPGLFSYHLTPVSDQDLGLTLPVLIDGSDRPNPVSSATTGTVLDVSEDLNDEFIDLFDGYGP